MPQNNLLVVDFDFFFESPAEYSESDSADIYRWLNHESIEYVEDVWKYRAAVFLREGLKLPYCNEEWKTFWSRFRFNENVHLIYADSNVYAAFMRPQDVEHYDNVVLYDAHHDCDYHFESYEKWRRSFEKNHEVNCGNWMLVHQSRGSRLHYRFPQWHRRFDNSGVDVPTNVRLESLIDSDSTVPQYEFTHVFLCRSGAWLPAWCDEAFNQFLELAPVSTRKQVDTLRMERPFNYFEAEMLAVQLEREELNERALFSAGKFLPKQKTGLRLIKACSQRDLNVR